APGRGPSRGSPAPAAARGRVRRLAPKIDERRGAVDGRCLGGRYRVGALLAAGGMGEVWAARDLLLDRPVAVKVLGGALAGDGRAGARLRREGRAGGRVGAPHI